MPKTPKEPQDEQITGLSLPDLPFDDPDEGQEGAEAGKKAAGEGKDEPNAALAAMEKRLDEALGRISQLQDQNLTLMAQPVKREAPKAPAPLSFDDLPDPAVDSQGFGVELAKRIEGRNAQMADFQAQTQEIQSQRTARLASLWEDFQIAHEEYAEQEDRVEFATQKVIQRAQARGVDIDRYLFTHSEKFMGDVVKEMDRLWPKSGEDDGEGAGKGAKKAAANRTGGMFGGQESGGKPVKGQEAANAGMDMFADIRKFQMDHGFY